MERLKKFLLRLLFPPVALLLLLVPISAMLLICSFVYDKTPEPVCYLSYALSAYALTVLCVKIPRLIRLFKEIKVKNRYLNRYFTDPALRVKLSLYLSLTLNTAYAVLQLGLGFYHGSVWFYSLAVYYILLAVMRYFLLQDTRLLDVGEDLVSEYKRYRFCGIILLGMNLAMGVIVFYITWQNRGFSHHFITTIAMAAYTFTALSLAIKNVVKYRKYRSPLLSASKAISLAAASVSVLTLESAMLTAFGEDNSPQFKRIMTGTTGATVCVLILCIAIYMIVNATRKLKNLK